MAGANLTIDTVITGPDVLARMDEAMGNTAPLLARIGEYLQDATRDRFKTQSGPDGSAWQALQPRYQRRKKQNKDKILTLRGYLRGQIHWQPDGDDAVRVGTNAKYGAIHQFGGSIQKQARQSTVHFGAGKAKHLFVKQKKAKRSLQVTIPAHQVNMPARPFLGINAGDQEQIRLRVMDWLNGQ
ncbi:phage virion morphogenesis protein [Comamonas suwonensis]|uniref:Phage virion morphogenesis protein n=1 Tax=Comamonas suwonensis TaxID=2606214 RepID=A0A843BGZ0_9BURK|nr:phage virion morphogenesis protein [Comamonas suwonensis]MBI1626958.1 phage virion morphogenesis protein [Comamonas suwonensis]